MAALTLGDGLRVKGRLVLFLVQESEHLCWKSHINENTILAGDCWNPFSTVFRISHTFSLFVLPSCHFLLWKSRKISSGGASPDTFLPPYPASVLSPDFPRSFISLYQHQTCDLVKTFKVSNSLFPSSLSFQFSLFTQGFGLENIFSAG